MKMRVSMKLKLDYSQLKELGENRIKELNKRIERCRAKIAANDEAIRVAKAEFNEDDIAAEALANKNKRLRQTISEAKRDMASVELHMKYSSLVYEVTLYELQQAGFIDGHTVKE